MTTPTPRVLPLVAAIAATVTMAAHAVDRDVSIRGGGADALFVDPGLGTSLWASAREAGTLHLPNVALAPGRSATLTLQRFEPFAANAKVAVVRSGRGGAPVTEPMAPPRLAVFRGSVDGDPDSAAFLAVAPTFVHGWVRSGDRLHVISSGPQGRDLPVRAFDLEATQAAMGWSTPPCQAELLPGYNEAIKAAAGRPAPAEGGVAGGTPGCLVSTVAIETDHEYLANLFGGDTDAAAAYAAALMSACSEIYSRDVGVRFEIGFIRLWETADDPWTQTGTVEQLYEFRDLWAATMGDVERTSVHYLSGRGLGGGVAWLPGLCNTDFGYALSANLGGSFPYPLEDNSNLNWDLIVTAHEFGHNFGAPHTHDEDPPVDGCGNGDCTLAADGTIMSYCHLCPGGLANIALTFAPASIDSILANLVSGAPCLEADAGPGAAPDFASVVQDGAATLDVMANDLLANCAPVSLLGVDAVSAEGGTIELCSGCGADGGDAATYTAPPGFAGIDSFGYQIIDDSGRVGDGVATVTVIGLRPADAAVVQSGVRTEYYAVGELELLPDFDALTPFATETASNVDYPSTGGAFAGSGLADLVGAVFTGYINAPAAGLYTLSLESDDGSRLIVGDETVVLNDGLHGMIEKEATIGLQAGLHAVRIEFFERYGGAGLIARWSGPGIPKQPIPAANWFQKGTADLDGDGLVNGADLGLLLAQWGGPGSADLDGSGEVDGADLGLLLAEWGA